MRWWRSPWVWSIGVHAALLATAGLWWSAQRFAPAPGAPPAAAIGGPAPADARPELVAEDARRRLDAAVAAAKNLPAEQQYADVLQYAAKLESVATSKSMAEIGAAFSKAMNFANRAYAPVAPPPAGAFDSASQLPYAVRPGVGKDGKANKCLVWLDKDGRTKTEVLTPQHPMAQNPLALAALERLEGSPTLRGLKDEILLKVVEKLLDGPAAPPGPR